MNEEGKGRHLESEPLGLAGPVEERFFKRLEFAYRLKQAVNAQGDGPVAAGEDTRGRKLVRGFQLGRILDAGKQELPQLASRIAVVPAEFRREGRVVAVGRRRFLLLEPRLGSDLGANQRRGIRVLVGGGGDGGGRFLARRHGTPLLL